jgi:hypothetical protein
MESHTLDKVRRENLIVKKVSGGLKVVTRWFGIIIILLEIYFFYQCFLFHPL